MSVERDVIQITCECEGNAFIQVFHYLENLHSGHTAALHMKTAVEPFEVVVKRLESNEPNKQKHLWNALNASLAGQKAVSWRDSTIIIKVEVPKRNTDQDILSYRYLLLVAHQFLKENDGVIVECDKYYYQKMGSFFIFESLFSNHIFAYVKGETRINKFPRAISFTPEWLPALYFSGGNSTLYQVLSNPLWQTGEEIVWDETLINDHGHFDFQKAMEKESSLKERFRRGIRFWLSGVLTQPKGRSTRHRARLTDPALLERLRGVPGMAQLLFGNRQITARVE